MSADNWAVCPRCSRRKSKKAAKMRASTEAAYGSVPADVYLKMLTDAQEAEQPLAQRTYREDYDIYGADEGEVTIDYSGGCNSCGLSITFTHSVKIEGLDA